MKMSTTKTEKECIDRLTEILNRQSEMAKEQELLRRETNLLISQLLAWHSIRESTKAAEVPK